jgi:hypothetical protein
MIALPPRARILVVALRRLGDVLLTTPLIRSLKQAFPDAAIDALVFAGTEGILAGNPDLAGVIAMPPRNPGAGLALARTPGAPAAARSRRGAPWLGSSGAPSIIRWLPMTPGIASKKC